MKKRIGKKSGIVLENPQDYFPYIDHELDRGRDPLRLHHYMISDLFTEHESLGDRRRYFGPNKVFRTVDMVCTEIHREISENPNAVQILLPRHRSLFDYAINQPVHHETINRKIILAVGQNLMVHKFNESLRHFGGFVFLRDDAILIKKGLRNAFLDKRIYLNEVLPQYLKEQMFLAEDDAVRHDLLVYLEYEKSKETGKSAGGRTKTGHLRKINWTLLRMCRELALENGIDLYVTPLSVSFSKVPDAPYVVHPSGLRGRLRVFRYFAEQRFVFEWYPNYAESHPDAKLDAVVHYGTPDLITDRELGTNRDFIQYADELSTAMGRLDHVFPVPFLCSALGDDRTLAIPDLGDRCRALFERLKEGGAHLEMVEDEKGNMRSVEELVNAAVRHLNTTPSYYIRDYKSHEILSVSSGRFTCIDQPLQRWYANTIAHFLE